MCVAGNTLSISNGLAHIPGAGQYLKTGTWGRTVADALGGGNPFTGALDAVKTLFGNSANAQALAETATGMAAAGPLQGFGSLAKGSTGGLSVAPDIVGKTAEVDVKAGAKLLGATAEAGEGAASGVGVVLLAGYGILTVGEGLYCGVTNFQLWKGHAMTHKLYGILLGFVFALRNPCTSRQPASFLNRL